MRSVLPTPTPVRTAAASAILLAGLAGAVPARAADVTAAALRRLCGDQGEPMASIGCEAYVDGFVTGLARAGAICPPGSAARDLRRGLLAAAPDSLAGSASDYLLEAARRGYPCPTR